MQTVVNYIEKAEKIVVMVGAGASTSCGIPDFRSPGGLYDQLDKYKLPQPTDIFDIEYFRKNPEPFFKLAVELNPARYTPSDTHYFIRMLQEKGKLLRCYTQNIDGLELKAGVLSEKLVQAHGGFDDYDQCIECGHEIKAGNREYLRQVSCSSEPPFVAPRCTKDNCNGLIKPRIVFFGEALPAKYYELSGQDLHAADLLIVMGTSLTVTPFCYLATATASGVPRILINLQLVGTPMIKEKPGFDFKSDDSTDVFLQQATDAAVRDICNLLNWKLEKGINKLDDAEIENITQRITDISFEPKCEKSETCDGDKKD